MLTAPIPRNEPARLAALHALEILDTPPEPAFDDLVLLASLVCGTPMAMLSLVDRDRQWFKAAIGVTASETPREPSFCTHAVYAGRTMVVPNAGADERFRESSLVTGEPYIRFYAGAPLTTPDGYTLGALCVVDRQPRELSADQQRALEALARQATVQLSLRRSAARLERIVELLPAGAIRVQNGAIAMNAGAEVLTGYGRGDIGTLDEWFQRLYPGESQAMRSLYETDRVAGFPAPRILGVTRADGCRRLIRFAAAADRNAEIWLVEDVTDREEAHERFRVLFESSSDAHLVFDANGIIDCNEAALRLLRCEDKAQLLSLPPAGCSPERQPDGRDSREKCAEMKALAWAHGRHTFEWTARRMDGEEFPVEVSLTAVALHGREALLVVWHDLTERKHAEEELRRTAAALEALIRYAPVAIVTMKPNGTVLS